MDDSLLDINWKVPIGTVIKAWREKRRLSLSELVVLAGSPISVPYLSQLESTKTKNPGNEHLDKLALALKVPVSWLVNRKLPKDVADQSGSRWETEGLEGEDTLLLDELHSSEYSTSLARPSFSRFPWDDAHKENLLEERIQKLAELIMQADLTEDQMAAVVNHLEREIENIVTLLEELARADKTVQE